MTSLSPIFYGHLYIQGHTQEQGHNSPIKKRLFNEEPLASVIIETGTTKNYHKSAARICTIGFFSGVGGSYLYRTHQALVYLG